MASGSRIKSKQRSVVKYNLFAFIVALQLPQSSCFTATCNHRSQSREEFPERLPRCVPSCKRGSTSFHAEGELHAWCLDLFYHIDHRQRFVMIITFALKLKFKYVHPWLVINECINLRYFNHHWSFTRYQLNPNFLVDDLFLLEIINFNINYKWNLVVESFLWKW